MVIADGHTNRTFAVVVQPQTGVYQADMTVGFFGRDLSGIYIIDTLAQVLQYVLRKTCTIIMNLQKQIIP